MTITRFNTTRLLTEWYSTHQALRDIIIWLLDNWWPDNVDFIPTSIYRSPEENKAINGNPVSPHVTRPHRALDARNRTLTDAKIVELALMVNGRYIYDPTRPNLKVLLVNDKWSRGAHFHFQVSDLTKIRIPS